MQRLQAWYGTALGQRVAAAEGAALGEVLADLGIGDVVRIGPGPRRLPLAPNVRQWCAHEGGDLLLAPEQLPFRGQSLEGLILAHVLEFTSEPVAVLAEAYQALRPEGRLIVLGFNPLGWWGMYRLWGRWRSDAPPWCGRQQTASAVGVRLRRAGFQPLAVHFLCFRPPLQGSALQKRLDPWEDIGRRFGRLAAAVQMTVACRREPGGVDGTGLMERAGQRLPVRGAQPVGCEAAYRGKRGGGE
ncbi:MAG: class I SAM-dependent methyltransferase [Halorhodospira sp.]